MKGEIIYEDEIVIVYDKLPGEDSEMLEGSPVGRLDKPVGGLMLLAKEPRYVERLSESYEKQYLAVVAGGFGDGDISGTMNDLLLHDRRKNKSFPVKRMRSGVRDARLIYEQIADNKDMGISLQTVRPVTGRTHQIRVQFASRKHPLFGDGKYGSRHKGRIGLYACRLSFIHPKTHEVMLFKHRPSDAEPWSFFGDDELDRAIELSLLP